MWGAVTNTGYNGMPTSLGLVCRLIHCLRWGSVADKPRTSRCTIVSVGDITDCATSTAYTVLLRFTPEDKVYKCKFVWNQVVGRVKSENLATHPPLSLGPGEFSYGQCFRLKKTNLHFIKLVLSLEYTVQYMYIYIFCNFFVFLFVSIGARSLVRNFLWELGRSHCLL